MHLSVNFQKNNLLIMLVMLIIIYFFCQYLIIKFIRLYTYFIKKLNTRSTSQMLYNRKIYKQPIITITKTKSQLQHTKENLITFTNAKSPILSSPMILKIIPKKRRRDTKQEFNILAWTWIEYSGEKRRRTDRGWKQSQSAGRSSLESRRRITSTPRRDIPVTNMYLPRTSYPVHATMHTTTACTVEIYGVAHAQGPTYGYQCHLQEGEREKKGQKKRDRASFSRAPESPPTGLTNHRTRSTRAPTYTPLMRASSQRCARITNNSILFLFFFDETRKIGLRSMDFYFRNFCCFCWVYCCVDLICYLLVFKLFSNKNIN